MYIFVSEINSAHSLFFSTTREYSKIEQNLYKESYIKILLVYKFRNEMSGNICTVKIITY